MTQLYLATFYRDNPYSGITADVSILNQHDAEEWYNNHQERFATNYPDAKDDPENDEHLDIIPHSLDYTEAEEGIEYRFNITPISTGLYISLK
jgi:hypothetical protein